MAAKTVVFGACLTAEREPVACDCVIPTSWCWCHYGDDGSVQRTRGDMS